MLKVDNSKKLLNSVIFCLDESGSMSGLRKDVIRVGNQWLDDLRRQNDKYKQETVVSFITFANRSIVKFKHKNLNKLKLDDSLYNPDGMTALFSSVNQAIEVGEELDSDYSNIVVIVTDGLENNSGSTAVSKAQKLIKEKQNQGNWSFVFLVPPGRKNELSRQFNVPDDNVREWTSDSVGLKLVQQQTSSGIANYYASRSRGLRATSNFFADLSHLKTSQVKRDLDDISDDYKMFVVGKECQIRDFVEEKTGRVYSLGTAYYELSKPEKVQYHKDILINKRGTKTIYGGDEARSLIGIPEGQDIKLEPKNLGEWRVFINSTSVNRKLVRGTSLLVKK